jgi:four helix bundle protein
MNNFRKLIVWQKAVEFTVHVYKATGRFPKNEQFGLVTQINRSAVSVASNIAEGSGRGTKKDFSNFLGIALASSYECETQLIISEKLGFISNEEMSELIDKLSEIQKIVSTLRNKFKE